MSETPRALMVVPPEVLETDVRSYLDRMVWGRGPVWLTARVTRGLCVLLTIDDRVARDNEAESDVTCR